MACYVWLNYVIFSYVCMAYNEIQVLIYGIYGLQVPIEQVDTFYMN